MAINQNHVLRKLKPQLSNARGRGLKQRELNKENQTNILFNAVLITARIVKMTFTEAFIITLVGLVGLLMWLMIVSLRVAYNQATKNAIKLIKISK